MYVGNTLSVQDLSSFYVTYKSSLIRYTSRKLGDVSRAEEVVQESLIKLLLAAPELVSERHALGYVKKTIDNLIIDNYRLEGRKPVLLALDELDSKDALEFGIDADVADSLVAAEDSALIRQALSLLSPSERTALVMWELDGRSSIEIAAVLGIKKSSVRHTVARARASLRNVLSNMVIDETKGITALDVLSSTYRKSATLARKSSRGVMALILIAGAFLGFNNDFEDIQRKDVLNQSIPAEEASKTQSNQNEVGIKNEKTSSQTQKIIKKESKAKEVSVRSSMSSFPGLDASGVPLGFTISDTSGRSGDLVLYVRDLILSESSLTLPSIVKTASGASNVFMNQSITIDSQGTGYEVLISYGREGKWQPLLTKMLSVESKRLASGNYLLSGVIQVQSEVISPIKIPASSGGYDLAEAPTRVVTRVLLDSTKTTILGQAVYVIEKGPK